MAQSPKLRASSVVDLDPVREAGLLDVDGERLPRVGLRVVDLDVVLAEGGADALGRAGLPGIDAVHDDVVAVLGLALDLDAGRAARRRHLLEVDLYGPLAFDLGGVKLVAGQDERELVPVAAA